MTKIKFMCIAFANVLFCANVLAEAPVTPPLMAPIAPLPSLPPKPFVIPSPPNVNAASYVLIEAKSGKILAEKNKDEKRPPASLTKLMTLYIISHAIKEARLSLNDPVMVSEKAWRTGGSKMFVRVGTNVLANDLIQGIVVASGNDACVAMSEHIAGSEEGFVQMMNIEAKTLGLNNTNFSDCTGLDTANHYSTAYDLSMLARSIIYHYPENYRWFQQKWYLFNGIKQPNRNRLLWRYPYADGMKTGHTDDAGYCLVASAEKNGMRLISVILGAPSDQVRTNDTIHLFDYGFRFFESHTVYPHHTAIANPRVWFGKNKTIAVGAAEDVVAVVSPGQYEHVKTIIQFNQALETPILKNQKLGEIILLLNNQPIAKVPLIALENNPKGNIFSRLIDHVWQLFYSKKKGAL